MTIFSWQKAFSAAGGGMTDTDTCTLVCHKVILVILILLPMCWTKKERKEHRHICIHYVLCHGNIQCHNFIRNYLSMTEFNFLITAIKERMAGVWHMQKKKKSQNKTKKQNTPTVKEMWAFCSWLYLACSLWVRFPIYSGSGLRKMLTDWFLGNTEFNLVPSTE